MTTLLACDNCGAELATGKEQFGGVGQSLCYACFMGDANDAEAARNEALTHLQTAIKEAQRSVDGAKSELYAAEKQLYLLEKTLQEFNAGKLTAQEVLEELA